MRRVWLALNYVVRGRSPLPSLFAGDDIGIPCHREHLGAALRVPIASVRFSHQTATDHLEEPTTMLIQYFMCFYQLERGEPTCTNQTQAETVTGCMCALICGLNQSFASSEAAHSATY